jgi:hypothetical protein
MNSIDVVGVIANMLLRMPHPALCLTITHRRRICLSSKCLVMSLTLSRLQEDSHAPFLSPAGAADDLNCIVCNGIPFDRYRLMTTTEKPCTPRRTLALTRHLLQSTLETKDGRIDAILCSPFFHSNQEGFDLGNTHYLRCGHDVWSAQIRPCASNCSLYPGCGNAVSRDERQNDLMFCRECVSRADLVFQRYTDLEQVTRAGVESGYVIAGSQFTPEAEDEYTEIETSDMYAHM